MNKSRCVLIEHGHCDTTAVGVSEDLNLTASALMYFLVLIRRTGNNKTHREIRMKFLRSFVPASSPVIPEQFVISTAAAVMWTRTQTRKMDGPAVGPIR